MELRNSNVGKLNCISGGLYRNVAILSNLQVNTIEMASFVSASLINTNYEI